MIFKRRRLPRRQIVSGMIFCITIFLLSIICSAQTPANADNAKPQDEIVLQLRWYHQFQFAGYYAAREKGFYEQAGLNVRIEPGGLDRNTVDEVMSDRAQYGVTNSEILLHYLQGKPVVVLAAIFQHSPLVLLVHGNSNIKHPQDLQGRRVKMTHTSRDVELHAMLHNEGVSLESIDLWDGPVTFDDYFNPEIEALSAYITNEPFFLQQKERAYRILYPITYGIDFYGDCLFTSQNELKNHPERVRAFREASLLGWAYAMEHPEEIIDIILNQYNTKKTREHLLFEAAGMENLILPRLVELGHINPGRWRHIADIFTRFNFNPGTPDYDLDAFFYPLHPVNDFKNMWRAIISSLIVSLILGAIVCLLVFFNKKLQKEITERKRAEENRRSLQQKLHQAEKTEGLGRMAGAIAHHFNNQLYVVMGNLEMVMDDLPLGVNSNENLVSAMQSARKAADVSRLMLTYLGQTPGKHEPIDLSETCHQSLTFLQATNPKEIHINAVFPSFGPIIHADAGQIQQVLTHLITNAWESISGNQETIALTVKTVSHVDIHTSKRFPIDWQPQDIAYACLEVSDTGCGISNKDIDKLFDPFFTTKFTGRGLGLPVVMGIVKSHGGGITVESEPGHGSTFRIFLPVSTEKLPIQHDRPVMSEAQPTSKAQTSKIEGSVTVLLIEDEEQVRNMAKMMLTRLGYTVLEAKDGVEALEIFQQHQDKIRFVLSDLTMPRMNGWDTLAALRKISPDIPVILSSGYDEAKVMAKEHTEIPNAFLGKPYQLKGLRETISRVLANKIAEV